MLAAWPRAPSRDVRPAACNSADSGPTVSVPAVSVPAVSVACRLVGTGPRVAGPAGRVLPRLGRRGYGGRLGGRRLRQLLPRRIAVIATSPYQTFIRAILMSKLVR